MPDRGGGDRADFLEIQQRLAGHPVELVLRHAINTPEVAAIGDADAERPDGANFSRADDRIGPDIHLGDGKCD
ncbi:MAG: hypothetical protein AMXMBFR20_01030 [Planctomycetia bacterium]